METKSLYVSAEGKNGLDENAPSLVDHPVWSVVEQTLESEAETERISERVVASGLTLHAAHKRLRLLRDCMAIYITSNRTNQEAVNELIRRP